MTKHGVCEFGMNQAPFVLHFNVVHLFLTKSIQMKLIIQIWKELNDAKYEFHYHLNDNNYYFLLEFTLLYYPEKFGLLLAPYFNFVLNVKHTERWMCWSCDRKSEIRHIRRIIGLNDYLHSVHHHGGATMLIVMNELNSKNLTHLIFKFQRFLDRWFERIKHKLTAIPNYELTNACQ